MTKLNIKELYKIAKSAKVGEMCICASCGTRFKKTNYQQAFCRSKGKTICKDKYWNTVITEKRCNTTCISYKNRAYYNYSQLELDRIDREQNELEDDGSWDNHQCYVERCEWCSCINCRCEY